MKNTGRRKLLSEQGEAEEKKKGWSLRNILWISFSFVALIMTAIIGIYFNYNFSKQLNQVVMEETQALVGQVSVPLYTNLRSIMKASDSLYYSVIKNMKFPEDNASNEVLLIYNTNQELIESISLFTEDGVLLEAAPAVTLKETIRIVDQEWFQTALEETENIHFLTPRVQNLFKSAAEPYSWVIPVSRAVEITYNNEIIQGVLLINMRCSFLESMFSNTSVGKDGYIYLIDKDGTILYHPLQQLIFSGRIRENHKDAAALADGTHMEEFEGRNRIITVKTLGYTGWKIIGVTKDTWQTTETIKSRLFLVFVIVLLLGFLFLLNSYISSRIYRPIDRLEKSVQAIEEGNLDTEVYVGGGYELRHLGNTIQRMLNQIKKLMQDIVKEHELKKKTELDILQSQINPHFLYNTLDIIVWMIENERPKEAARIVTALARLFRISLSKGKRMITLKDEMEHVSNYLMIQKVRYKNKFDYHITLEEDSEMLTAIKLIVQPIVENAIYYGMEYMDGDGEISIWAGCEGDQLLIKVRDNGPGMTPEKAEALSRGEAVESGKKGSGIGVRNVLQRIQLYFGEEYGLSVWSEPDEGTEITICLPVIPYDRRKEWWDDGKL